MMRVLLLLSLSLGFGCAGNQSNPGKDRDLSRAVRDFNQAVRWQNWNGAARHVDPERRPQWLQGRLQSARGLQLTEMQMLGMQRDKEDVVVLVSVGWFRVPDTKLRRTVWRQLWRYKGRSWVLTEETPSEAPEQVQAELPAWP